MADVKPNETARISISPDKMSASVIIPQGFSPELLTTEFLAGIARERRVVITQDALSALAQVAAQARLAQDQVEAVFACGQAPAHGEPARLVWLPGFDPERHVHEGADGHTDFYHIVDYVRVSKDQAFARIDQATEGVDGMTVTGEVAKAKPGRPLDWQFDTASTCVDGCEVRSKIDGVLLLQRKFIKVSNLIEVSDVDFSTGNISVEGGVHVRSEVKDRFEIHATQDVIIDGLVESAVIECGGNLQLKRGMAAHDRGHLVVRGNAEVGYLNAVHARIEGTLQFRKEIMNCDLSIGVDLVGDGGSIIGGKTAVTGGVRVAVLGSEAEIPTRLVLGTMPMLFEERAQVMRELKHAESIVEGFTNEMAMLQQSAGKLTAQQKERLTELNYVMAEARQERDAKQARIAQIDAWTKEHARVDLLVQKLIHPKVVVVVDSIEISFKKPLNGPVRLGWDSNRRLVLKRDDGSFAELGQFVTVKRAA